MQMLERLSAEQEDTEDYLVLPPLGKHYTLKWAEEDGGGRDGDSESGDENKANSKRCVLSSCSGSAELDSSTSRAPERAILVWWTSPPALSGDPRQ